MRLLTTILITLLLSSCGDKERKVDKEKVKKVEKEKLPGRYVLDNDTIDIMDDGTYKHFTFNDGKRLENTGTWKLRASQDEILFEDFSFLTDGMPPRNWHSRLRVDGEEIHLMYAKDINAYYKKVGELDSLNRNDR